MFPLGGVLLPQMVLPLHVFEPRYRALMRDVLDADGRFGVVLIDRGHEVGGDDVRGDVGAVARVLQSEELDDGRWLTVTVGERPLRVVEWLPDDPYPRALVELLDEGPTTPSTPELLSEVESLLRRVLALLAELDRPAAPATVELDEDPRAAAWQVAVLAPGGPLDKRALLDLPDVDSRLGAVRALLVDAEEVLRLEMAAGGPPSGTGGDR